MGIMKTYQEYIKEKYDPVDWDSELLRKLKYTIDCAEKYKNAYFWNSSSSSSSRKHNEESFYKNYPDYEFEYKGNKYEVGFEYRESGRHVYFSLDIYKNGNKTNLTVIKTIYKKLSEIQNSVIKYNL
jgi:hypothetical protein